MTDVEPAKLIWHAPDEAHRGRRTLVLYAVARTLVAAWSYIWFRARVEGREHVPRTGPVILAPVHRSNIDTLLMGTVTRRPLRFMGKDSLWRVNRQASWLLTALGGFPVARGTADREALRRCEQVLALGQPLVMFPEGTRQFGPVVQPCFDGPAFLSLRTGTPIVPIGIGGSERAQRKGSKFIRPTKVRLVVGEPMVPPAREGRATSRRAVRELTEQLHREVQSLFDLAQIKAGPG
jgi:1-acyl-sn-glycerol-3-phosphate acyltransferase